MGFSKIVHLEVKTNHSFRRWTFLAPGSGRVAMSGVKQSIKPQSGKVSSKSLKAQPPPKPFLSAEFVQDTSDEDLEKSVSNTERSRSPASKKPVPVRKVQVETPIATAKPKPTRSIKTTFKVTKSQPKPKPKPKSPSPPSTDSSATQSDEDDESGTGSQSEGETESSSESISHAQKQQQPKVQLPPPATPALIPYKPPPGFETASIVASKSSNLAGLFAPSHLEGKQLWHITVPSRVPIDSIKEVATENVQNGNSVLSYKGSDYGLVSEILGENGKEKLLLPDSKSNGYRDANTKIVRTLHLQLMVQLPSVSHRSGGLSDGATKPPFAYTKTVRQQPEGLKMRYRPFGDSESSSLDSSDEIPQFHVPAIIEAPHQSVTSRHKSTNDENRDHRESSSRSSAKFLGTPTQSKKRNHDTVNGEKHDNRESTTKLKKRKTHKAKSQELNYQESPAVPKQVRSQPKAAIDSPSTKSIKNSPTKTTITVRSSPKKSKQPQADPATSPHTTRNHPPEPKEPDEPKANLKEDKSRQNLPEEESPNPTPKPQVSEPPSTPAPSKPQRTNAEKRQRKEAKRRRHEARESALKD